MTPTERTVDEDDRPTAPDLHYVWEKLLLAVLAMAGDERGLRERLHGAYLHFHVLRAEDFPVDLQGEFLRLEHAMPEGPYLASLARLDDHAVRTFISQVVWLCDAVARRHG